MINIRCVECQNVFEFDDKAIGADGPATSNDPLSQRYIVDCPQCHGKNMIWLKRPTTPTSYHMDVIIVKDEPQDFR